MNCYKTRSSRVVFKNVAHVKLSVSKRWGKIVQDVRDTFEVNAILVQAEISLVVTVHMFYRQVFRIMHNFGWVSKSQRQFSDMYIGIPVTLNGISLSGFDCIDFMRCPASPLYFLTNAIECKRRSVRTGANWNISVDRTHMHFQVTCSFPNSTRESKE